MKATRKLIPAFAMLLIAAVMMSTATFAWFSTNSSVTANGMTIQAKADGVFIVISKTPNDKDSKLDLVTFTNDDEEGNEEGVVIPVTAFTEAQVTDGKIQEGAKKTNGKDTIVWGTGTSTDPESSTAGGLLTQVTADRKYVVEDTFYIRTAAGFPDAYNLYLSNFTVAGNTTAFNEAVSVVLKVTIGENTLYYIYENFDASKANEVIIAETVPSNADITITSYVYINGEHANVKTANATSEHLKDMNVTMEFTVKGK